MNKIVTRAATVAVLSGLAFAAAPAAEASAFPTFHPRKNVTAKQLSPGKMKFTNRTPYCVALTVKTVRPGQWSTSTHRLWYTHQTQKLWLNGKVTSVRVYRPGC